MTWDCAVGKASDFLPRPRIEIQGSQGVQDGTLGRMCTATLINDIESY